MDFQIDILCIHFFAQSIALVYYVGARGQDSIIFRMHAAKGYNITMFFCFFS